MSSLGVFFLKRDAVSQKIRPSLKKSAPQRICVCSAAAVQSCTTSHVVHSRNGGGSGGFDDTGGSAAAALAEEYHCFTLTQIAATLLLLPAAREKT